MSWQSIRYELTEGGVALITLDRPDALNAVDDGMRADFESLAPVLAGDDVRAAVITGAGDRAFCAGADIKTFVGRDVELAELWLTQKNQLLNRGLEIWKPVIAAVNGFCVGGGMTLLLATDIRVAGAARRRKEDESGENERARWKVAKAKRRTRQRCGRLAHSLKLCVEPSRESTLTSVWDRTAELP